MNKQRLYYYVLYGLLLGGIAGKLIGLISLTHNFFFDWITEGMILLFLLLESKSLFRFMNPGIQIQQSIRLEDTLYQAPGKQGWLFVGVLIRILGILFFGLMAALALTAFRNTEYIVAAMCIFFALLLLGGVISYMRQNPYYLVIDESGVTSYFFSFKKIKWEDLSFIGLKPKWIALQPKDKAVNEIEFENLPDDPEELVSCLRSQAIIRNIRFKDQSKEYESNIWE